MASFLEVVLQMLAPLLVVGLGVFVVVRFMRARDIAQLNQVGQQIAGAGNYVVEDSPAVGAGANVLSFGRSQNVEGFAAELA